MQMAEMSRVTSWDFDGILGGARRTAADGALASAKAYSISYLLQCKAGKEDECKQVELDVIELFKESDMQLGGPAEADKLQLYYFSELGIQQELLRTVIGSAPLFVASNLIMAVFLLTAFCKFGDAKRDSKMFVGQQGTWAVTIGTIISFGTISGLGISFTPVSQVVAFLLLAIGVDDMFILVRAFEHIDRSKIPGTAQALGAACAKAGASITVTSVTDAIAFLVGSTIRFPAMQSFCLSAAIGVLTIYVLELTFVAACLSIQDAHTSSLDKKFEQCRGVESVDGPPSSTGMKSGVEEVLEKHVAPVLCQSSRAVKFGIVGGFVLFFIFALFAGTMNLELGFKVEEVFPDDSYVSDRFAQMRVYSADKMRLVSFVTKGLDYHTAPIQKKLLALPAALRKSDYCNAPMESWLVSFLASPPYAAIPAAKRHSKPEFNAALKAYLATPQGAYFQNAVKFNADNSIRTAKINGFHPASVEGATAEAKAVQDMYRILDEELGACCQSAGGERQYFPYGGEYVFWGVWEELIPEAQRNLLVTGVCIFVGCSVFLLHPLAALIVMVCCVMSVLELVAWMYFAGVTLSSVTLAILIMSFGLIVDYSAHITHHFMTASGSTEDRAAEALSVMGSGVFNGAFTTLLGFAPMAFSTFEAGRVFTKMFAGIIVCGIAHGFILLPVMLSLWGPDRNAPAEKSRDRAESKLEAAVPATHPPAKDVEAGGGGGKPTPPTDAEVAARLALPVVAAALAEPLRVGSGLNFWFGCDMADGAARARLGTAETIMAGIPFHFMGGAAFDAACVGFAPAIRAAAAGELEPADVSTDGAMARLLLLDQFARNAFRGTAEAFSYDEKAREICRSVIAKGLPALLSGSGAEEDRPMPAGMMMFLATPMTHSEELADHLAIQTFNDACLGSEELRDVQMVFKNTEKELTNHRVVIEKFGRYPHRNAAMERESTAEEDVWMAEEAPKYGWAMSQQAI